MDDVTRVSPGLSGSTRGNTFLWLGPLAYVLLVGIYFLVRTGGLWTESDSAVFARIIRSFVAEGRLVPEQGAQYPNGYTFQAISTFVISVTGLDVTTLQQIVYPLLAGVVVIPAWVFYREVIGTARGAALATILLLSQPEFLFVILRSSHEKFSRALVLICLFLLVRSFRLHGQPRALAKYVIMFYFAAFALIASNNLLSHSFMFSIAVALLAGRVLQSRRVKWPYDNQKILFRLPYVLLTCIAVFYVFTFYVYSPAQHQLLVAQTVWDRIASLFLGAEDRSTTNAYSVINTGWTSLSAYVLVSLANWTILLISFGIWLRQGVKWLVQGETPGTQGQWILWLLYAAFGVQVALSMIVDFSGALSSNLQQRLFPSLSIIAVALVAGALEGWQPARLRVPARVVLTTVMMSFAVLSVMKATNEPFVSNTWIFYRPSEISALTWTDRHLDNSLIWTDYDARLVLALEMTGRESSNSNQFYGGSLRSGSRTIVLSSVARARSERLYEALPVPAEALRVYDNGETQVFHRRPVTPFEP